MWLNFVCMRTTTAKLSKKLWILYDSALASKSKKRWISSWIMAYLEYLKWWI